MRFFCILPALFYLVGIVPAHSQNVSKAKAERSRKFVALGNFISTESNSPGINLLIDYEATLGDAGEQDLADWVAAGNLLRPIYARRIFDILLRSKNSQIVLQGLGWLGYDYAYICKDEEVGLIKTLLQGRNRKVALRASQVLSAVERDKQIDRDSFWPDRLQHTHTALE